MCIVVAPPRIASAYVVHFGKYGQVSALAQQRGVSRQWLYREATAVVATLQNQAAQQAEVASLRQQLQQAQRDIATLRQRLEQAVLLDAGKQAQFATVGQARGVSLPDLRALLQVLAPGGIASVARLGRWTQAAGRQAGAILAVLDCWSNQQVIQALGDEIYVRLPVRMIVEPDSLCWVYAQKATRLDGAGWTEAFASLPKLEQLTCDAGQALGRGLADLNRRRQQQKQPPVRGHLDHFHVLREGGRGVTRAERAAQRAQKALAKAQAALAKARRASRRNQPLGGLLSRQRSCQKRAEKTLASWIELDGLWNQAKAAVQLFTPDGTLNSRARAQAILAEILPQLPDAWFGKAKRQLRRPEVLNYLDDVQEQLQKLPIPVELRQAAVRQEGLRRHPPPSAETPAAAALRGVLIVTTLILAQAESAGAQAVAAVRQVLRRSWRASSLVECVNSVLRMQQARHRKLTQGLLDLKRLYWNCHCFRTGRRRGKSPYELLGIPLPAQIPWWELLHLSPDQLRLTLSTSPPPT